MRRRSRLYHYDGARWVPIRIAPTTTLALVAGTGEDVIAIGADQAIQLLLRPGFVSP